MKLRLKKNSTDLAIRKSQKVLGPTPEMLIAQAIDRKVPVETMEKLLALMTRVKAERAKEAFFRDLAGFQAVCPIIVKCTPVLNKDKKTVRYHYATLDEIVKQVKSLLQEFGFSYTVQTIFEKDPPAMVSITTIHHVEGHSRESEFRTPVDVDFEYMSLQQKHAAASTFSKRYSFCNAFGILTGDEDKDAQDFGDGSQEGQTENVQQGDPELKEQIVEELKSSVFNNDRAVWFDFMKEIKMTPGFKGMLKRVKRERKDREDAIKSEK